MQKQFFLNLMLNGLFMTMGSSCHSSTTSLLEDIAGFQSRNLKHVGDDNQNVHTKSLMSAQDFEAQKQALKSASTRTYTPKPLPQAPEDIKTKSLCMIKQINLTCLRPPEQTPVYTLLDPTMMRYIRHNTKPELDDKAQATDKKIKDHREERQKLIQEQGLLRLRIQAFEDMETLLSQDYVQVVLSNPSSKEILPSATREALSRLDLLRKKTSFSDNLKDASFLLSCMRQTLQEADMHMIDLSQELIELEKERRVLQREISQLDLKTQRAFEARQKFYAKMQEGVVLKSTPLPLENDIYAFWYEQGALCLPEANDLPEIQSLVAKGYQVKMNLLKGMEIVAPATKTSKEEKIDVINAKERLRRLSDEFGWESLTPNKESNQAYFPLTLADIDLKGSTLLTASIMAYLEEPEDTIPAQSSDSPPTLTWPEYFIAYLKNRIWGQDLSPFEGTSAASP